MDAEREKLVRETWSSVGRWLTEGNTMNVPIRHKVSPRYSPDDIRDISPRESHLKFERGIEYSDCGQWVRFFIECEGLRLREDIEPRRVRAS